MFTEIETATENSVASPQIDPTFVEPVPADSEHKKGWASRLRKQAKELAGDIDKHYMALAEILYRVYDAKTGDAEPVFKAWGYPTFEEWVDKELSLGYRKAQYLRHIWYKLEIELSGLDVGIKNRIIALGWSKARILLKVLTLANASQWIDRAELESYTTLDESCRSYAESLRKISEQPTLGGTVEIPMPPKETFVPKYFNLAEDQGKTLEIALEKAAKMSGSDKRGHLLEMMATDFIASNQLGGTDTESRVKYVSRAEKHSGYKLIAYDPDTKEIVYGQDTLETLAADLAEKETSLKPEEF